MDHDPLAARQRAAHSRLVRLTARLARHIDRADSAIETALDQDMAALLVSHIIFDHLATVTAGNQGALEEAINALVATADSAADRHIALALGGLRLGYALALADRATDLPA